MSLIGGRVSSLSDGLESAASVYRTPRRRGVESASRAILERGMDAHRLGSPLLKGMEDAGKSGMGMGMGMDRGSRVVGWEKLTPHRFPLVHDQHGEQRIRERAGGGFGREGR